jgi:hypothetical protein
LKIVPPHSGPLWRKRPACASFCNVIKTTSIYLIADEKVGQMSDVVSINTAGVVVDGSTYTTSTSSFPSASQHTIPAVSGVVT